MHFKSMSSQQLPCMNNDENGFFPNHMQKQNRATTLKDKQTIKQKIIQKRKTIIHEDEL